MSDGSLDMQFMWQSEVTSRAFVNFPIFLKILFHQFPCRLMKLLLDTESGDHVKYPFIKQDKIKALKLEPGPGIGIIALDGEVYRI